MPDHADAACMNEALALARRGLGYVEPNPAVGAVIVRDGETLGRGWHARHGGEHAEVAALADARAQGHDPAGATLYVTLEPCSHHGKTPPCTDALIEAKIARAVVAMIDPFPQVAGAGVRRLREAGLTVDLGLGERDAHQLNEPYLKRVTTGLPWVILKWAQTLDGRIATATGDSQWISNEQSRRRVHELRARVDAIMVGIGTVLADDPRLTARDVPLRRIARRVVVDPALRMPESARLLAGDAGDGPGEPRGELPGAGVVVATDEALLAERGERVLAFEAKGVALVGLPALGGGSQAGLAQRFDLRPLLARLAERHGATNVLVEGGAGLAGALLGQGLVDQVLAFVAPKLVGDADAPAAVRGLMVDRIATTTPLALRSVERIGDDVLLDYRLTPDPTA